MQAIADHLAPNGRAVIDIWLPTPDDLAAYDGRVALAWQRIDPTTGEHVAKHWSARHSPASAVARVDTSFDVSPALGGAVRRVGRSDELHLLGVNELLELHRHAGLVPRTVAGDHDLGPLQPDSERVVVVSGLL